MATKPQGSEGKEPKKGKGVKHITPEARLSFPSLFVKRKYDETEEGEGKHECTLLFSKKKNLKAFNDAIKQVAIDRWGTTKGIKLPLLDGDNKGGEVEETYAGHYYAHARSRYKVAVIDTDKNPLTEEEVYAGCYVRASVMITAGEFHDPKTKKLKSRYVKLNLRAIMKTRDGERFANASDATDDFDEELANDPDSYSGAEDDDLALGGDEGDDMDLSEYGL